ncbi:MAG: hypothetical protein V4719_10185 [Planctomycetota bacterium]
MLHYHGTPIGGKREDVARFLSGRHALIPFPRPDDIGVAAEVCQSFALDNGAFSAWRAGEPVTDWTGYYDWVNEWRTHPGFDWAIVPDVIDGDEKANDDLLAEWPFGRYEGIGVPVWHLHESLQRLEFLVASWPRVALGSSGEWRDPGTRAWWHRIGEVMGICTDADNRPRAKLHGLRMLDPAIFSRLPLASADSTNAAVNGNRKGKQIGSNTLTGQTIIADRIEQHQSAGSWVTLDRQRVLSFDLFELDR